MIQFIASLYYMYAMDMVIVYLNNLVYTIFRIDTLVVIVAVPIILLGLYFVKEEEEIELLKRSFTYMSLGYTLLWLGRLIMAKVVG